MEWHKLLDEATQTLNLKIESYCEKLNGKESPRYFHANCSDSMGDLWRLKVANISKSHDEVNSIGNCLCYNNLVHPIIVGFPNLRPIVRIPRFFPIPNQYLRSLACSELLELHKPGVEDIPLLIRKLLDLQGKDISKEIRSRAMQTQINKYNRDQCRCRLVRDSGNSLLERQLLSKNELDYIAGKFDNLYPSSLPEESLTLVHGDFAFGNLTLLDDHELGLIDFEHTHIGSGLTDLAHLYVNLRSDGDDENAKMLISTYEKEIEQRGARFNNSTFDALVLERAAGKLNSMKQTNSEKVDRLKVLLLEQ